MSREFFERYGARWSTEQSDLEIEMYCIRRGGRFKMYPRDTKICGEGLEHHYEQMRKIIWPELDTHRWHTLCRDSQIQNKICVLMGPGSSGKTHEASWYRLCEYFVFSDELCLLVSSTDLRGLQLRVWGEIKMLYDKAKERFPELPGNLLESKLAIATDSIGDDEVRDLRKGIIGIPCVQSGKYVGLGKYAGIKQKRVRLLADEAQFMGPTFLSAFANLDKNVDFRATIMGNPCDIMDPLGKAAEPADGWQGHLEPDKTCTWRTRFMDGICVNLVGTDSPNFDYPQDQPARFPYLISNQKIANTTSFFAKDSLEYYSQCVGVMKVGTMTRRVVTRDICIKNNARDTVVWADNNIIPVYALDSAYGGDRCIGGKVEFGRDVSGRWVINCTPPKNIPILLRGQDPKSAEEQIAEYVKEDCENDDIDPGNMFHDSTGRGGLGTMLAKVWSADTNPVEFGGKPTPRPVSLDHYIYDPKLKKKRLKRCDEHYDRFVTELWWSIRLAIESGQIRGLPEDVMEELCMREWDKINEGKIYIETKKEMKERVGRSPDLGDWLAIAVEGCRRRGFVIAKMAEESYETDSSWRTVLELRDKVMALHKSRQLNYSA